MQDPNTTKSNFLTDKMNVKLDMFGSSMLYWVVSKRYCTHIVTQKNCSTADMSM